MLAYLRGNTGNWIIKIFLGIIVVVFVFLGVGDFGASRDDSVASIDDQKISMGEYQQAYRQIIDQLRSQFGNNLNDEIIKALNVQQQALNSVIDNALVLNQAEALGINVTDRELQENLLTYKAFQINGAFDLDQYKKVLRMNSLTPEMFEESQLNAIRRDRVRQMVVSAVNVSDLEAKNWYLYQNTKVAVDYLKFDPTAYKDIQPDEKAIQEFFDKNKQQYKTPPKIKANYLKFDPQDHKSKVQISAKDVQAYYQENIKLYETPDKVEARHILIKVDPEFDDAQQADALKQAEEIYKKAKKGDDFAQLAKTYSQGPSKANGGHLGTFDKQAMVKPFADKAFSMKAGDISEPVKTQFGWHIIKVESKIAAAKQDFDSVKEKIEQELALQEMQNLAYNQADEAFEAVIDGDDFEQIARIANKKPLSTKAFSAQGEELDMVEKVQFARAAFELKLEDISDVKQLGTAYYLIQVIEKIEPAEQPLAAVKERVVEQLKNKLQIEAAKNQATAIVEKLKSGESLQSIADQNNLKLETTALFSRNDTVEGIGNNPAFIQAGFSLNETNKTHPEIIETVSGFFILGFNRVELPDDTQMNKSIGDLKKQITQRKQTQSFQAWLAEIKKQHNIVYDPSLIKL